MRSVMEGRRVGGEVGILVVIGLAVGVVSDVFV